VDAQHVGREHALAHEDLAERPRAAAGLLLAEGHVELARASAPARTSISPRRSRRLTMDAYVMRPRSK
jgi:hypothetical protein